MAPRISPRNLQSTASAAWKRRSRWMAPTSAIRRWAAAPAPTSIPPPVGRGSKASIRAPAGCRRRLAAALPGLPTSLPAPARAAFTGPSLEFVRNSASTRCNYFDHPTRLAYPGRRLPSLPPQRVRLHQRDGGPAFIPHVYDGRKRTPYLLLRPVSGLPPGPRNHPGDACANTARQRTGLDNVTYSDGSTGHAHRPSRSWRRCGPGPLSPAQLPPLAHFRLAFTPYATASPPGKVATDADQFSHASRP